jgi:hypothetical protein
MIQIGQSVHFVSRDGGEYPALVQAVFSGEQAGTAEPVINVVMVDLAAKEPGQPDRVLRRIRHLVHCDAPGVEKSLAGEPVNCWRHAILDPLAVAELPELPGFDPNNLGQPHARPRPTAIGKLAGMMCDYIHGGNFCPREHAHAKTPFEFQGSGALAGDLGSVPDPRGAGQPVGYGHTLGTEIEIPGITDDSRPELPRPAPTNRKPAE